MTGGTAWFIRREKVRRSAAEIELTNGKRGVDFSRRQERVAAVGRHGGVWAFLIPSRGAARERGDQAPGVCHGPGAPKRGRGLGIYFFLSI